MGPRYGYRLLEDAGAGSLNVKTIYCTYLTWQPLGPLLKVELLVGYI